MATTEPTAQLSHAGHVLPGLYCAIRARPARNLLLLLASLGKGLRWTAAVVCVDLIAVTITRDRMATVGLLRGDSVRRAVAWLGSVVRRQR